MPGVQCSCPLELAHPFDWEGTTWRIRNRRGEIRHDDTVLAICGDRIAGATLPDKKNSVYLVNPTDETLENLETEAGGWHSDLEGIARACASVRDCIVVAFEDRADHQIRTLPRAGELFYATGLSRGSLPVGFRPAARRNRSDDGFGPRRPRLLARACCLGGVHE